MIIQQYLKEPEKQNEHYKCFQILCEHTNGCELFKRGECVRTKFLDRQCVYGFNNIINGPTRRSKWEKQKEFKEQYKEKIDLVTYPKTIISKVGEYIYLPYPHMDLCEDVPFVKHDCYFVSGVPFVREEDFTPENIYHLINFRPQAMLGSEIQQYQEKHIPIFLFHLKHLDWTKPLFDKIKGVENRIFDISKLDSLKTTLDLIPSNYDYSGDGVTLKNGSVIFGHENGKIKFVHKMSAFDNLISGITKDPLFESLASYCVVHVIPEKTTVVVKDKNLIKRLCEENPYLLGVD